MDDKWISIRKEAVTAYGKVSFRKKRKNHGKPQRKWAAKCPKSYHYMDGVRAAVWQPGIHGYWELLLHGSVCVHCALKCKAENEKWVGEPEAKGNSRDLGVDGKIILEWVLEEEGGELSIGLICSSGGSCELTAVPWKAGSFLANSFWSRTLFHGLS